MESTECKQLVSVIDRKLWDAALVSREDLQDAWDDIQASWDYKSLHPDDHTSIQIYANKLLSVLSDDETDQTLCVNAVVTDLQAVKPGQVYEHEGKLFVIVNRDPLSADKLEDDTPCYSVRLTLRPWEHVIRYTMAPVDYDGFGTTTMSEFEHEEKRGKHTIRVVAIAEPHLKWQLYRYGSGMYWSGTEVDWEEAKDLL